MSTYAGGMSATTKAEAPVPASAAAIVELLNSRACAFHPDLLETPDTAAELLRAFGHERAEVSPERLSLAHTLRADLASLVAAQNPAGQWTEFTGHTSELTFSQHFSAPGEVRLRQVAGDTVAGGIALAVAELVDAGTWSRLRVCANDHCGDVFYDTTRSRTRRWHSYEICGNRTNVAAYRARTTAAGQ
jgi:predicted RNA-binding Zn ribbon-like protein